MAEIIPFNGLLYNARKVGDLSRVMAPPYDVISPKLQDTLYARHPNNIVRLILGKINPDDSTENDRYRRAAADLSKWINDGVFVRDERPAIYYYTQSYALKDGTRHTRRGFIALSRIEEFGKGGIHPHERTLSGPKADRLKLMQACGTNLSCIFSLYSDPGRKLNCSLEEAVKTALPLIDVRDDDGIENRLWRIEEPAVIKAVAEGMKNRPLFIADGHHRYETALNYRDMMREKNKNSTGTEPYDYVMMYFSNMDDEGMTIWPTHRVIHSLKSFDGVKFIGICKEFFDIVEFRYNNDTEPEVRTRFLKTLETEGREKTSFGLHIRHRDAYYVLMIKTPETMGLVFGAGIPDVFKKLDVTVLHSLILSKILGITQEAQERQENLVYVKSHEEAINACGKDGNQLVFLLNPTRIEQVRAVAEAGYVMPQKSTYFYPKLLSGLVINLLGTAEVKA